MRLMKRMRERGLRVECSYLLKTFFMQILHQE